MSEGLLPVLWLYGPPGVGKTTVAWELFTQLVRDGTPTGYVDIDPRSDRLLPPDVRRRSRKSPAQGRQSRGRLADLPRQGSGVPDRGGLG